ncbi:MAG TPA: hypothetical protein VF921_13770 [Vicinamibacterales bacterium]
MTRFILKLLLFAAPVAMALGVVERSLGGTPNAYTIRRGLIDRTIDRAEVIVTGSSHAYYGIRGPSLHPRTVSFAAPSQDLYYDSRLVAKYIGRMARVKLAVVTVSYFSMEAVLDQGIEAWRSPFYARVFGIPHYDRLPRVGDESWIAAFGADETRRFVARGALRPIEPLDDAGGFGGYQAGDANAAAHDTAAIVRHHGGMRAGNLARNTGYLNDLVGELRRRHIAVALVTTPCSPAYYEHMDEAAYARMQAAVIGLAAAWRVEYRSYLKDSRFEWDDFRNADHLSTPGALKFTGLLKADVVDKYVRE